MGGRPPRGIPAGETGPAVRRHRAVLARLARPLQVQRPLAGDGRPLGDDAQADDLRADRRTGRGADRPGCPSRSAASATGTTATPGSATPRSRSTRCSGSATPTRRARSCWVSDCVLDSRYMARPSVEDHVPRGRLLGPAEEISRPLRGVPGLQPGAHRQRRRRPTPARHLRRGAGRLLPRRQGGAEVGRTRLGGSTKMLDWFCEHWDQPEEGIWETRGGQQDFIYGRFMCWVAMDRAIRLATERGRPADIARWRHSATPSTSRSWRRGGTPSAARSSSTTTPTCSTPRCC